MPKGELDRNWRIANRTNFCANKVAGVANTSYLSISAAHTVSCSTRRHLFCPHRCTIRKSKAIPVTGRGGL
jgi:hypothetical protein